ncbi:MAG: Gfo/Idh/MocA family oxidoreductase [Candidatus Nanopelagicales bacterium]|nr:Gfo/Idh/MocA family oxidoreductase [Candidatus Nanopelagicales bacterium]
MSVKWGFIGAGGIAKGALADAVHKSPNADLHAAASRDPERSRLLSPKIVYPSYQELLEDQEVDAVYISLANHQHLEWVVRSFEAGKHVLCEKPLGLNAPEVERMTQAARDSGKLLVEAVWARWHPRFQRLAEVVQSGEIGTPRKISTAFTFEASIDGNYRANPKMGGGALLDVGVYEMHALVGLLGCDHELDLTSVERSLSASGIDLTTRVQGVFGNSCLVDSCSSFEQSETQTLDVIGTLGKSSTLGNEAFTSWKATSALAVNEREEIFAPVNAYQRMVENVSAKILGDPAWVVPVEDSIRVAQLIDQISTS